MVLTVLLRAVAVVWMPARVRMPVLFNSPSQSAIQPAWDGGLAEMRGCTTHGTAADGGSVYGCGATEGVRRGAAEGEFKFELVYTVSEDVATPLEGSPRAAVTSGGCPGYGRRPTHRRRGSGGVGGGVAHVLGVVVRRHCLLAAVCRELQAEGVALLHTVTERSSAPGTPVDESAGVCPVFPDHRIVGNG